VNNINAAVAVVQGKRTPVTADADAVVLRCIDMCWQADTELRLTMHDAAAFVSAVCAACAITDARGRRSWQRALCRRRMQAQTRTHRQNRLHRRHRLRLVRVSRLCRSPTTTMPTLLPLPLLLLLLLPPPPPPPPLRRRSSCRRRRRPSCHRRQWAAAGEGRAHCPRRSHAHRRHLWQPKWCRQASIQVGVRMRVMSAGDV
jgi:hypothetical protein